jgi:O-antigen/teichoic acid export membrane protein
METGRFRMSAPIQDHVEFGATPYSFAMTLTRRLISGTTLFTLSNGVVRLLSIVTMPILTGLLSPHAYGVAALAGTVISLVSVFGLAGVDMSYSRAYHSAEPPSGPAVEHYCWRFAIVGALLTAVVGAVAWWFLSRDSDALDRSFAILVAAGVILSVLHTMTYTRAFLASRHRPIASTTVVTGLIGAAASIGIAFWHPDALALLLPLLLGYLIPVLLLGTPSLSGLLKRSRLTWHEGAALIKIGLAGVVTAPVYWLLTASDRWFIQYYHGAEAVGVYSIAYSVATVGMIVNGAVIAVWSPEAAREYEEDRTRAPATLGKLMSRLVAAMAIIWLAVAAAGGDIVRWLANERFHDAARYVPYIAGGVFFYGVLRLASTGLLLAKQFNWTVLWWSAGGLVCMLLNLALVPDYGGVGAAVAQSVSFAVIALGILASSQAKIRLHLDWGRLALTMLIVSVASAFLVPPWHGNAPYSLLMKLPIGIAVALGVAWFAAPDWCVKGMVYLRRRALR